MAGNLYTGASNTIKIGREVTFGTAVAPIEALYHTGFSADVNFDFIESKSYTGTRATGGAFMVGKSGAISLPFEADSHNLGWIVSGALGSETLTTVSAGEFKHSFKMLNGSFLPSYTFETSLGGAFHFTNSGAVCNGLSLDISPKSIIQGTSDWVFMDQVTKGTPTALTLPANPVMFSYNNSATVASVKVNNANFGEIKSCKINIANNVSIEDSRLGSGGKLVSFPAGKHKFSGSMVVVYNANSALFETGLATNATFDLKLVFDSGVTLGSGTYKLEINIPFAQISALKVDSGDFIYYNIDFSSVGDQAEIAVYNDKATKYLA